MTPRRIFLFSTLTTIFFAAFGFPKISFAQNRKKRAHKKLSAAENLSLSLENTAREQIIPRLAKKIRGGLDLSIVTEALSIQALKSYHSAELHEGRVPHSLLGLNAAFQLSRSLPKERAPIPILQSADFIFKEHRADAYNSKPQMSGNSLKTPNLEYSLGAFKKAIDSDDLGLSNQYLSYLLDNNRTDEAIHATLSLATREFGRVGHGSIMGAHIADLLDLSRGERKDLLQTVFSFMMAFRKTDFVGSSNLLSFLKTRATYSSQLEDRLKQKHSAVDTAELLAENSAKIILLRKNPDLLFLSGIHLVTMSSAIHSIVGRVERKNAAEASEILLRAGSWMDHAVDGKTELSKFDLNTSLPKLIKVSSSHGKALQQLYESVNANSFLETVGTMRGYLEQNHPVLPVYHLIAELASLSGHRTLQHSTKLASATITAHKTFKSKSQGKWMHLGVNGWMVHNAVRAIDSNYEVVLKHLDLKKHPAIKTLS